MIHKARREIKSASEMLEWEVRNPAKGTPSEDPEFWKQLRRDIADHGGFEKGRDRVGQKLEQFRTKLEELCRPIVERQHRF